MEIFRYVQEHFSPFQQNVFRLAFWLVVLAVVFVPLERMFSLRRQKIVRKGLPADLAYYFLSNLLPGIVLAYPIYYLGLATHRFLPWHVHVFVSALPVWAQLLGAFLAAQLGAYWMHRWFHEIPALWRFHAIHHSAEEMDFLVNSRAHPVDMILTRLGGFIMIYLLGLSNPPGHAGDVLPIVISLTGTFWGFFVHANVRWRFGPLEWLLATPAFHHWHHTRGEMTDRNYAATLPWLDRLFGTYYMPRKDWPRAYGTDTPVSSNLVLQLIDPLVEIQEIAGILLAAGAALWWYTQVTVTLGAQNGEEGLVCLLKAGMGDCERFSFAGLHQANLTAAIVFYAGLAITGFGLFARSRGPKKATSGAKEA
jgi:sterol desaturase/sphingolipid hydroxylase (fatty acid hydroxylase superfamily)